MSQRGVDVAGLRAVGESAVSAVLDRVGRGVSAVQERTPLPYDVLESDDAYLVVFDAPGATSSDVQVRFRDGAVEVRVDRFRDPHDGFEMRFPGRGLSLDGRAELPPGAAVDPGGAASTLTGRGTLRVRLPKTEADREHAVEITDVDADAETADAAAAADADAETNGADEETLEEDDPDEDGDDPGRGAGAGSADR
ncbi:Hsp20/alpha crystallin family protein [Halobaculum sp. P14]|uniref:Hsp20/alpha crystallin family protein n=1 Tax=Halobaculum sp. P14 TaxID=3421638 RepID=UPI003EB8A674